MTSWEERFSQQDSQYSTSMPRDIDRGQTEVEHILGFVLNKAVKAQIPFHPLLLAYANVKAFEQLRAARRLPRCAVASSGTSFIRGRPINASRFIVGN